MSVGNRFIGQARLGFLLIATVVWMMLATPLLASETASDAEVPAADQVEETAPPADAAFTSEELRALLAPIALYPDALLAQLLPATAYPIDIVMAARWLNKNEAAVEVGDFSGADAQGWDPSVKALVRFPDIIKRLNADLDATSDLGDAFVNQPDDVAVVIQDLRREAQQAGSLKSTPQQTVTVQKQAGTDNTTTDYVVIEPADPGVIYVPTYDPATVYYEDTSNAGAALIGFGTAVAVGVAMDNAWDWGRGYVYPPRWPGYPGFRPGLGGGINHGNINIGNDINIGNIGAGNTRPWRPDPGKYHPGQGSKPGLANRPGAGGNLANRPGGGKRPGGLANARPGGGDLGAAKAAVGDRLSGAKPGGVRPDGIKNSAAARKAVGDKAAGAKAAGAKAAGTKAAGAKAASAKAAGAKKAAAAKGGGVKKAAAAKAGKKPVAKAAARPRAKAHAAPQRRSNSAFSGASLGGHASGALSNRGAISRQSVSRPGGGRPHVSRGGGGGGRAHVPRGGGRGRR